MTKRERDWLEKIRAGEAYKGSMAAYAREHRLKVKDLYQWKTRLRRRGLLSAPTKPSEPEVDNAVGDFVRVGVPAPGSMPTLNVGVRLPNGVQLSFQGELNVEQLRSVIIAASELT